MSFSTEQAFAVKVCMGFTIGFGFIIWSAWQHPETKPKNWIDAYLFTLLGGIIGARVFYIVLHYKPFLETPLNIPRVWFGEFSWQGAIVGGLVAAWWICRRRKLAFGQFTDGLALAFPAGWMAVCYAARSTGLLSGQPVANLDDKPVWMASFLPDINRDVVPRTELQMLGVALGAIMLLLVTLATISQKLENRRLWLVMALAGISVFILERYSGLAGMSVLDVDLDQVSAGILVLVSFGIFIQSANRRESTMPQVLVDRL